MPTKNPGSKYKMATLNPNLSTYQGEQLTDPSGNLQYLDTSGQIVYADASDNIPDGATPNYAVVNTEQGGVQVAESAPSFITTGSARGFIVPFIANMYVDASGTVGTLQEVTVTMTGIDQIFDVVLSEEDSVKILNAFQVSDEDAGLAQNAANVVVTMRSDQQNSFIEGLTAALTGTTVSTQDAAKDLYAYLKSESRKDTVDILSYDSLANLLEASDLLAYDIAIDASGGATNMFSAMESGSESYRNAIFKQIPKSNVHAYLSPSDGTASNLESVSSIDFLPLLKGDKLTFVFDVTVGEYGWDNTSPSSGAAITSVVKDAEIAAFSDAATGAVNATSTYSGNQLMFTTPSRRRVALTVQFATGGSAFDLSEAITTSNAPTLVASE